MAALALLALQAWPGAADSWRFDRGRFDQGAWYLTVSAQFIHLGWGHARVNAFGLGLLVAWGVGRWGLRTVLGAAVCAVAAVGAMLAWDVNCRYYAGASGWLHGLLAGLLWLTALAPRASTVADQADPVSAFERRFARLLLPVLAAKLWLETTGIWPQGWDFPVYTPAHVAGVVGGSLAAFAGCWLVQKR